MSVSQLAFPLVQYDRNLIFQSLNITAGSTALQPETSILSITRVSTSNSDEIKAQLKLPSGNAPLQFIENNIFYEDELHSPLLIQVPKSLNKLRLKMVLNYSEQELLDLQSRMVDQLTVYDELLLIKVKKDTDYGILADHISKNNKINEERVRSLGRINIIATDNGVPTQSALEEKTTQHYPFPTIEKPIEINTSIFLNIGDSGYITFYVCNKTGGKVRKLLKFAIYKTETTMSQFASSTASTNERAISFENESPLFPLNDGPEFRQMVSNFEEKIPQLKELVTQAINSGKALESSLLSTAEAKLSFAKALEKFARGSTLLKNLIRKEFEPLLKNSANDDEQLQSNLRANVLAPLNSIPAINNINALNSNKKIFEDESQRFYAWLNKYLSSGKSKDDKFLGKKKAFELSRFDYLSYLNDVGNNSGSTFDLMNYFITFINNFDRNQYLILPQSPKEIHKILNKQEAERKLLRKKIDSAKTDEELDDVLALTNSLSNSGAKSLYKAGLLYTYGGQGKQGWHKQWIVLSDSSLIEYADWRKGKDKRGSAIDISLCSVKPVVQDKRKNCFEIITSRGTKSVYQATSEAERDSWIKALYDAGQIIQFGGSKSLKSGDGNDAHRRRLSSVSLKNLTLVQNLDPSNMRCCDCDSADGVEWISLNLLIIFCIHCSSAHRNLGTSISKVRSLKLDNFSAEQISLLSQINNSKSNSFFESELSSAKIKANASDKERLDFIGAKYKDKSFLKAGPSNTPASNILLRGMRDRNFNEMLWAIALGANINMTLEKNEVDFSLFEYSLTKPLRQGDLEIYDIAEFLILNGTALDQATRNALPLSDSALRFWNLKIEKIYGSPITAETLKENYDNGSSTSHDRRMLKVNTNLVNDHPHDSDSPSEKKFTSPTSATARYSRNLIKKMTNNNSSNNNTT